MLAAATVLFLPRFNMALLWRRPLYSAQRHDPVYKIKHFFLDFSFRVSRAARVACSNTSRTPSFVFAEHSRYFWAPIFLRTSSAC